MDSGLDPESISKRRMSDTFRIFALIFSIFMPPHFDCRSLYLFAPSDRQLSRAIGKHALTNGFESNKKVCIARGAVHAERSLSNPMNLIRVMPAKGSGLLGTEVSEHEEWPDAAFPLCGEAAFFLLFANRKSYGNCAMYQWTGGAAGGVHD